MNDESKNKTENLTSNDENVDLNNIDNNLEKDENDKNSKFKNKAIFIGRSDLNTFATNLEPEIKRLLADWGDKQFSMPKGFGHSIKIIKTQNYKQFLVELTMQRLIRNVKIEEAAGNQYSFKEGSTDAFDYNYNLPDDFKKSFFKTEGKIIPSTVTTFDCVKNIKCGDCNGSGICPSCRGDGRHRCFSCRGNIVQCNKCITEHSGKINRCGSCIIYKGQCLKCRGEGYLICNRCKGSGYYQQYHAFYDKYSILTKKIPSNMSEDFTIQYFNKMKFNSIYSNDLFESTTQQNKKSNLSDLIIKIGEKSNDFKIWTDEYYASIFPPETSVEKNGKCKINIFEIETYKVEYTFNNEQYLLYVCSGDNENYYIQYSNIPKLPFKDQIYKFLNRMNFYLNPFSTKKIYYLKTKLIAYFTCLLFIAKGKKDDIDIKIVKELINYANLSEANSKELNELLDKENTLNEIKEKIKLLKPNKKDYINSLMFAFTLHYKTNILKNKIYYKDNDSLDEFANFIGVDEYLTEQEYKIPKLINFTETNMQLMDNNIFDNFIRSINKKTWAYKNVINVSYLLLIIIMGYYFTINYLKPQNEPEIIKPLNEQQNIPLIDTFYWKKSSEVIKYNLIITDYSQNIILDTILVDTFYISNNLLINTTYNLKLKAINDYGESDFTGDKTFSTIVKKNTKKRIN